MRMVYKYPITSSLTAAAVRSIPLEIHEGFQPLHVARQDGVYCLWAIVDVDRPKTEVRVEVLGTGCQFLEEEKDYEHLGTFFDPQDQKYVWHMFLTRKVQNDR